MADAMDLQISPAIAKTAQYAAAATAARWPDEKLGYSKYPAIGVARTRDQMLNVGKLRYELFVERDGKDYGHADRERHVFLEPIDDLSLNFHASYHQRCLAAVRLTWAIDADIDQHLARIVDSSGLSDEDLPRTVLNSRLAIREEMRARLHLPELFRTVYRAGFLNGAKYCLLAARPSLSGLFHRFGFREQHKQIQDPTAGELVILRFELDDREHLRSTASPLLQVYDELISSNHGRSHA